MPGAWSGKPHFTIGELGFGTGLNFLATWKLWRDTAPNGARLSFINVEGAPLGPGELERAHGAFPSLSREAAALRAAYPPRARGFHVVDLDGGVRLMLLFGDAATMLRELEAQADAWFLDGFAPAQNPGMWTDEVLAHVARCSKPGASAATYTAAGDVRRALEAAGFTVDRIPGFGRKKHMVRATRQGTASPFTPPRRVAVIGAGIAGLSAATALTAEGASVSLFDGRGGPLQGASGTPSGLVMPRIVADTNAAARFSASAFRYAVTGYASRGLLAPGGGVHLGLEEDDARRFAFLLGSGYFTEEELTAIDASDICSGGGSALHALTGGAFGGDPQWAFDLSGIACHWNTAVASLTRDERGWRVGDQDLFDAIVVASGDGTGKLLPDLAGALLPSHGQVSRIMGAGPPLPVTFGGYITPAEGGAWIGASHEREPLSPEDANRKNLAQLAKAFPDLAEGAEVVAHWRGTRATSPDRLPLAGPMPDRAALLISHAGLRRGEPVDAPVPTHEGLYVIGGLGSRGLVTGPILGAFIAARVLGCPSPLERSMAEMLSPARFLLRDLKRNRI